MNRRKFLTLGIWSFAGIAAKPDWPDHPGKGKKPKRTVQIYGSYRKAY